MSITLGIAIYFILWWTILFAVLPFGVTTQREAGDVVEGSVSSAPANPRLLWKAAATTMVSAVLFAAFYAAVASGLIDLQMSRLP